MLGRRGRRAFALGRKEVRREDTAAVAGEESERDTEQGDMKAFMMGVEKFS